MRVAITLFVENQEEAKETLAALAAINALPWRQSVFGVGPKVPVATAQCSALHEDDNSETVPEPEVVIENCEPPGEATKSIKRATEQKLKELLRKPHPIEHIKPLLKAPKEHCENLLRLLWDRGIITFDGKNYQNSERE